MKEINAIPARAVGGAQPPQVVLRFGIDTGGLTRVTSRRVVYPYAFLKPFWFGDRPEGIATVMLQSASGGLYGGEKLGQRLTVESGAAVHFTTQAATILRAARGKPATEQNVSLELASCAYLEYLPEATVLFPDGSISQRLVARLDPSAILLVGDGFVRHDPGRLDLPFGVYRNDIEVYERDGGVLFTDRTEVSGDDFGRSLVCRGVRWRACGLFAAVAPAACDRHGQLAATLNAALAPLTQGKDATVYAACAELPNRSGVVCRVAALGGADLRAAMECCWRGTRLALTGILPPRRRK